MTNNREIKFRGFHRDETGKEKIFVNGEWVKGYWVYGVPVFEEDRCYIIQNLFICSHCYLCTCTKAQVIPETVGQYTGLKDKNGKEIFEGDIVEAWSQGVKGKGKVTQRIDGSWLFYPSYQHNIEWELCINQYGETDVVVIGNIYENPELLEVK